MRAITVSRQLGSLGTQIAHQVAQRLGYRVVWREAINRAAHKAGAPEMALVEIDDLGLLGLEPSTEECDAYHMAMRGVMRELADAGEVVIIGRAGQVLLRDRADVLHVKVIAPAGVRAERVAGVQKISVEAAAAQVEASDRIRAEYLQRCFDARWDNPVLYDLIVNTRRLSTSIAADLICDVFRRQDSEVAPSIALNGEFGID
jgi:cytidylate kinase